MVFYGMIFKLKILYKYLYASLNEYNLYLTKLLLINEKYIYAECIKKNQKIFKIGEYGKNIKTFDFESKIIKMKKLHN